MASTNTLRGKTLRGKTLILAAPSGGLEPAVLPMSGAAVPAAQNLTQSARFDNSQTFYTHTITSGSVTLTATRYDNTQTYYTHVLTQTIPAQNIAQTSRYDNQNTYYTHSLTVGAVTLSPNRFDNAQTFYSHTVTTGAVGLTASRLDNTQTFYSHAVTVGSVTLTPSRYDNSQTFYTHEITNAGGVQSLTQSATFDNSQNFYTHTLTLGAATQYLVARDHVETGWVEDGWVGWSYFNVPTFYEATLTQEVIEYPVGGGASFDSRKGGLSTRFNKATRKKLKKIEELAEELQEVQEQQEFSDAKESALVTYEALIKDAIRSELNSEILLEINAEQYARTKAIIEGIISTNENRLILEEEEAITMIMMALLENNEVLW